MHNLQKCERCPNVKLVPQGAEFTVEVVKGMRDGEEIKFFEEGEPIVDGDPGDLKFFLRTRKHKTYAREGNNLRANVSITLVSHILLEGGGLLTDRV